MAKKKKNKGFSLFWKRFITVLQVSAVLILWFCALTAFISPEHCKALIIFSLGFPFALAAVIMTLFLSLIFTLKRTWISLVGLLACFGSIRTYMPINLPHTAPSNAFSVMTFNTHALGDYLSDDGRHEMITYLRQSDVDFIVAQETFSHVSETMDSLKYTFPYSEKVADCSPGQTLFSKYPILNCRMLDESQLCVVIYDVKLSPEDTLTIVSCHLQSTKIKDEDRENFSAFVYNTAANEEEVDIEASGMSIISSLMENSKKRAEQVDSIAKLLEPFEGKKLILCGDFNDTPISYTREKIRSSLGLTDCFRATGNGIGRSYNRYGMYVRIDHMFCSDLLKPYEAHVDKGITASDHYPLICKFRVRQ